MVIFVLNNGKVLQRKISTSERLKSANEAQLNNFELLGGGVGIHWPDVDEDISLKGLLKEEILSPFPSGNTRSAMAA